jgi:hypothetical protein
MSFFIQIFDKDWHKVSFGVFEDKLALRIDCEYVGMGKLKPRRLIKIDGDMSLAKMSNSNITVPVSLVICEIHA